MAFKRMFDRELHLDFETYSACNLKKHGLARYMRHPTTEVLFLSYAIDDGPVKQWIVDDAMIQAVQIEGFVSWEECMPSDLVEALNDPKTRLCAHNAAFERLALKFLLHIETEIERWYCSMVHAMTLSLPGGLDDLCMVLRIAQDKAKMKGGKRLVTKFCTPRKPTKLLHHTRCTEQTNPKDWADFLTYGALDVEAEREAGRLMKPYAMPQSEMDLWFEDQRINDRGIPIDLVFTRKAYRMAAAERKSKYDQMNAITKLQNSGSGKQLLPWLRLRGYPFKSLKKERVERAIEDFDFNMTADAMKVVLLLQEAAKSSVGKYEKVLDMENDGNAQHVIQFAGAGRTSRWAGRGWQPHNFPRPERHLEGESQSRTLREAIDSDDIDLVEVLCGSPVKALATAIRLTIKAPPRYKLAVADLASIETVVIGWLARCEAILDVFREGKDAYKMFAMRLFNKAYHEVTKRERQMAKPAVLGAGYRLGGGMEVGTYPDIAKTGLLGYAESLGVKMTPAEAASAVATYREMYPEVCQLWYDLENAVSEIMREGGSVKVGYVTLDYKKPFLRIRLPSGRFLHYLRPKMQSKTMKGKDGKPYTKRGLTYEGYNDKRKWTRIDTHGGKLVENIVQAIARDILALGIKEATRIGMKVVLHVHDEIVAVVPCSWKDAGHDLEKAMTVMPDWLTNMPLRAEAFETDFYYKG